MKIDYGKIFSACVTKQFSYLTEEFGFRKVTDEYNEKTMSWTVVYQSSRRHIELVWGFYDVQFYFGIYRMMKNGKPAPYADNSSDHFYIFNLVHYYEPGLSIQDYDIGHVNPSREMLESKIKLNAEMLYKYGKDILKGLSWFDWQRNVLCMERELP